MKAPPQRAHLKPAELEKTKTYGLIDPDTMLIGYVGITDRPLSVRLSEHIAETREGKGSLAKQTWLKDILESGKEPGIVELPFYYFVGITNKDELEQFQIIAIRAWYAHKKHARLVNEAIGGAGQYGTTKSEEERARIGASVKAYHASKKGEAAPPNY